MTPITPPPRGFSREEFVARAEAAQTRMAAAGLSALLVCTEPEVHSLFWLFWLSPTRPWFVVIPREGIPVAVISSIGVSSMSETWGEDIRTWSSPAPEDDGVTLLADTIRELAGAAFDGLPGLISIGDFEREAFAKFRIDVLQRGADDVPYLVGSSGPDGFDDVIKTPSDRLLEAGDILLFDTGSVHDGYFSDFDRNFAFGHASDAAGSPGNSVGRHGSWSRDAGHRVAVEHRYRQHRYSSRRCPLAEPPRCPRTAYCLVTASVATSRAMTYAPNRDYPA